MSPLFYTNVLDALCDENENYKYWIKSHLTGYYNKIDYYPCNIIEENFDKWIEENV